MSPFQSSTQVKLTTNLMSMPKWRRWGMRKQECSPGSKNRSIFSAPTEDGTSSLNAKSDSLPEPDVVPRPQIPPVEGRVASAVFRRTSDDASRRRRTEYLRAQSLEHADEESLRGPFRLKLPDHLWQDGWVELVGMMLLFYDSESPLLRRLIGSLDLTDPQTRLVRADAEERIIVLGGAGTDRILMQGGALPPYFGDWADLLKRKMILIENGQRRTSQV